MKSSGDARAARIVLPAGVRAELSARAEESYPREACGLLIGSSAGVRTHVERVVPTHNATRADARERFEIDPGDLVASDLAARADGLSIVGVWHSHPDHPAEPSESDRTAAWERWSYLIVPVTQAGAGAVRSWRVDAGELREEAIDG